MIGCIGAGFVGDKISRRGFIVSLTIVVIGSALQASSFGVAKLIVGRIVMVIFPCGTLLISGHQNGIHYGYGPYLRM
jgi:MFS family permease